MSLDHSALSSVIDDMRYRCRLRDLDFFGPSGAADRTARIKAALDLLGSGRFVIGLGPYCPEVIRVGEHPIRIGRHASPFEESRQEVIDYAVSDSYLYGPREVSRIHCSIDAKLVSEGEIRLTDEGSSTGTWLQPHLKRLEPSVPHQMASGSLFSLGPSGTSLFLFVSL
jgi:hypothetical protein